MNSSILSITRLVLSGALTMGLAACSVSAGPTSPDSDFFPKPSQPVKKPTPTPQPNDPAEVQLSDTLSYDLWSGFGVHQGSSVYREGTVQISCTKTTALSCYGSFVEDNYLGYMSAAGIEPLIPNIVKPDAVGSSYRGTLKASCSRRGAGGPVCIHKLR